MEESFIFEDLAPATKPVQLGKTKYLLKEASLDAVRQYNNCAARAAKFDANGSLSGIDGAGNVEPLLVSLCLFELGENGEELRTAPEVIISKLPARIIRPMFDWIKRVSLMDGEDTLEAVDKAIEKLQVKRKKLEAKGSPAKNLPPPTTGTST